MVSKMLLATVVMSLAYESEAGGFFSKWFPGQSLLDHATCSWGKEFSGFETKFEIIKSRPKSGSRCAKFCLKERTKHPDRHGGITGSIWDNVGEKCECVVGGNPRHGNTHVPQNVFTYYCWFNAPEEKTTTTTEAPTTTKVAAKNPCEGVESYYDQIEFQGSCYVIPMMPADIQRSGAPRACEKLGEGFHLAKITTPEIQNAMTDFITGAGMYDDFVYLWIDGSYNMGTGVVTLDDGSTMTVPTWAHEHPKYVSHYTGMLMLIWYTEANKPFNGIVNYKEEFDFHTYALCDNS